MPYVPRKKTVVRKPKKYTRKSSPTIPKSLVNLGAGLPQKMLMTHKYTDFYNVAHSVGVQQNELFSVNGMSDPSFTHTGHQPLYFDQMSALYRQYTVLGSKITWKICQNNTGLFTVKAAFFINDDTTVSITQEALTEQPSSKGLIIPSHGNKVHTITQKWSSRKAFGKNVISNPSFTAVSTANPAEQQFFTMSAYSSNLTSPMSLDVQVEIEYIAIWTELRDIASS